MKQIGEGYYYRVYDLGNNLVLKKKKNNLRTFLFIFPKDNFQLSLILKSYHNVKTFFLTAKKYYLEVFSKLKDLTIIGNPTLLNETDYVQKKVKILGNLNHLDNSIFENIILDFTKLLQKLW